LNDDEKDLPAEIANELSGGIIQLNQKEYDGKALHLKITASNDTGEKVSKRFTFVPAKCTERSLTLKDAAAAERPILYEVPFMTGDDSVDAGSITDLFTNSAEVTCPPTMEF
jgi:hypothetical protein